MLRRFKDRLKAFVRSETTPKLEAWFYYWLREQRVGVRKDFMPKNCYYEFGVGWGDTMCEFAKAALRVCSECGGDPSEIRIVGFDSFEGLPPKASRADDHPTWERGSFAFPKERTLSRLEEIGFPVENVRFVEGFFDRSLTAEVRESLRAMPPSIVTVDVDYYSSTKQALDFVGPLLGSGTVFYFDDLYAFHLHPDYGQPKAIAEFQGTYGYLNPLREFDYAGRTYLFARKEWEYGSKSPAVGEGS